LNALVVESKKCQVLKNLVATVLSIFWTLQFLAKTVLFKFNFDKIIDAIFIGRVTM